MMMNQLIIVIIALSLLESVKCVLQINCTNYKKIEEVTTCLVAYFEAYTGNSVINSQNLIKQEYYSSQQPLNTLDWFKNRTFGLDEYGYGYYSTDFYYYDTKTLYDTLSFPVIISFSLASIGDISSLQGTMTTTGYINLYWGDYRLRYNTTLASSPSLSLPSNWVWTPEIVYYNAVAVNDILSDTTVELISNGFVVLTSIVSVTSTCDLDLSLYPFDKQTCKVIFTPSTIIDVGITFQKNSHAVLDPTFHSSPSWKFLSISSQVSRFKTGHNMYSSFEVTIQLQRYSFYYITTAIIPNILITVLAVLALWIGDYPNRLALEVTLLLTVVALLWSVSSSIPSTAHSTWLSSFTTSCLLLIVFCTIETIIVYSLSLQRGKVPEKISSILRLLSQGCSTSQLKIKKTLLRLLNLNRHDHSNDSNSDSESHSESIDIELVVSSSSSNNNNNNNNRIEEQRLLDEKEINSYDDWATLSKFIDILMQVITVTILFTYSIVYYKLLN